MTETTYEKNLRYAREAKAKRTGTCRVCGAETRYAGKPGKPVSELCKEHATLEAAERRRGTGDLNARILAYLAEPRRFTEIRDEFGITSGHVASTLDRLRRYGLVGRISRGLYVRT